ncbi:hypothetical protein Tco_1423562 [Tanacetum coccineum]
MKMTAIMIMTQVVKAVIKRATVDDEFVKTLSNYTDDEDETNVESKVEDNAEGNEDKGMDYTTNQFDDDVDVRLNEPVNTDEGFIQKEGTDAEMINVQQGNENLEITLNQVIEDAHVTIYTIFPTPMQNIVSPMDVHVHHEVPSNQTPTLLTVPVSVITESSPIYTTVILQSLPSFTPLPPQSTPTPPPTTEATNPLYALLNFASVFQFNTRVLALEKEVVELKKGDLLNTQVTALVDEHLDLRLGATRDKFISYLSASITARIINQVKIQLPQILRRKCLTLLLHVFIEEKPPFHWIRLRVEEEEDKQGCITNKRSKIKESKSRSSKGTKSQSKSFGKSVQAEEPASAFKLLKGTHTNFVELEYDFEECYKALSEKLDLDNPEGDDYPFDLTKPLPLNRLTNLSSDDVFNFAIALRMFTRSIVIQKRVEDLQMGVASYQKKINVTKTEITRPGIRKRDPYTPYQDPQGFIYVDNQGRNKLMRSDELYKFSDGTLTRLRSSLDDITKNIQM